MHDQLPEQRTKLTDVFLGLDLDRSVRILDVACGTGIVAEEIRSKGYCNVDGLDPVQGYLTVAQSKGLYKVCVGVNTHLSLLVLVQGKIIFAEITVCTSTVPRNNSSRHINCPKIGRSLPSNKCGMHYVHTHKGTNNTKLAECVSGIHRREETHDDTRRHLRRHHLLCGILQRTYLTESISGIDTNY